jgi:hypothetical protein
MMTVSECSSGKRTSGDPAQAKQPGQRGCRHDPEREADQNRPQRPRRKREPTFDQSHTDAGQRAVLGSDDHRPDKDDGRIGYQTDRADHRRDRHQDEEGDGETGALHHSALHLLPHHRIGRGAHSCQLSLAGGPRYRDVDVFGRNRSPFLETEGT